MFYCKDCDTFFNEPNLRLYQDKDIWHQSYISVCPFCKSDDITEAVKCAKCSEYVAEIEENGMCIKCVNELQMKALEFIKQFNSEELEIVLDYLNEI